MLALFSKLVRRFRGKAVRALDISGYRGPIVVKEDEWGCFSAESSPDGGDTVYAGYGGRPFLALYRLLSTPVRMTNVRAFKESQRRYTSSARPKDDPIIQIDGLSAHGIQ